GPADGALGQGGDPGRVPGGRVEHLREERGDIGVRQRPERDGEQPGADGRQQLIRVGGGEDEGDVRRRLLEQLEQRVGGLRARVLGDEVLRLADEEDLAAAERGPGDGHAGEGPDLRDVEADRLARRGDPGAVLGAFRQLGDAGFLERCGELLRPGGALRPRQREEPLEVRVLEPEREPAVLAGAAGLLSRGRLAEEELAEPEAEPLLADAGGAVEEDGSGQLAAQCGAGEELAGRLVPAHGGQAAHRPGLLRSHSNGSVGSGLPPATGTRTWNSMWGPSGVRSPPTVPITWPAVTRSPSFTLTEAR